MAVLLSAAPSVTADSWSYPAKVSDKVFTFGDTKIVLTVDGTKDQKSPDFLFRVYENEQLRAQIHNVWFEQVFASPDRRLFLGLSNSGIPGTAAVLFDRHGSVSLLVNHGIAKFDYCEESVTVQRRWYDEANPRVDFHSDKKAKGTSGITLADCRGQIIDLGDVVLKAYNTTFQGTLRDKAAQRP